MFTFQCHVEDGDAYIWYPAECVVDNGIDLVADPFTVKVVEPGINPNDHNIRVVVIGDFGS